MEGVEVSRTEQSDRYLSAGAEHNHAGIADRGDSSVLLSFTYWNITEERVCTKFGIIIQIIIDINKTIM